MNKEYALKRLGAECELLESQLSRQMAQRRKHESKTDSNKLTVKSSARSGIKRLDQLSASIERVNVDLYRLKCYVAAIYDCAMPSSRDYLVDISERSRVYLVKLAALNLNTLHALTRAIDTQRLQQQRAAAADVGHFSSLSSLNSTSLGDMQSTGSGNVSLTCGLDATQEPQRKEKDPSGRFLALKKAFVRHSHFASSMKKLSGGIMRSSSSRVVQDTVNCEVDNVNKSKRYQTHNFFSLFFVGKYTVVGTDCD